MGTGDGARDRQPSAGSTSSSEAGAGLKNLMDLRECIQDSPHFRLQLKEKELELNDLEMKLEKVVNTCDRMVATGNSYTEACRSFSVSIKELSSHFKDSEVVTGSLKKFYEALSELQSYYSILFDQAQRSVQSSLRAYLSGELRKAKDTKKTFHKISDELTGAINRNSHAPKSKPIEAGEASAQLVTIQNQFSHHAIDYGYQINTINCHKGYEILHNLLAFMHAQFTFFHQGYDLLKEFDPFMKNVAGQVDLMRKDAAIVSKEMETRHSLVSPKHLQDCSREELQSPMLNPTGPVELSGYLFKRPRGSRVKSWSRRWFILKTNKLVYQSESKEEYVTVAEDLRICTIKLADDLERRFCFEVVTPSRSCMLQADSEALRKKWHMYLEAGIERALRISASNKKKEDMAEFTRRSVAVSKGPPIHMLSQSPTQIGSRPRTAQSDYSLGIDFLEIPGNDLCADCTSSKPTWASINLGIMLCIECSGIHRGLGVHISKVRSVQLDDWEPELQKIMCSLGNNVVNSIYEYDIPSHIKKPTAESSRAYRENYIRLKYIQHGFVHPHPDFTRPDIPVPPVSLPDLLTPSKTPLSLLGGSPKSPHKRSFSPGLKIRSSKTAIGRFSRPSSAASSVTDQSSLNGSEEDLRKPEITRSLEPTSTLHLMAENFVKLEKEKEKKIGRGGSWNFGDKIKSARRSSKKISNYAMSKLGEGQESIMRRLKRGSKDTPSAIRETHSDTEEDTMNSQSTPLLFSMSASTQNLSSSSFKGSMAPAPPKPPRTFKIKNMQDLAKDCPDSDPDEEVFNDEFSADVLSAIKKVGMICVGGDADEGVANGTILGPNSSSSLVVAKPMLRSESSPELLHAAAQPNGVQSTSETSSLRLQTISEDHSTDSPSHTPQASVSAPSKESDLVSSELVVEDADGVPLRKEMEPLSDLPLNVSTSSLSAVMENSSTSTDTSYATPPKDRAIPEQSPTPFQDVPLSDLDPSISKRHSVLSTTSTDFFSAESSEGSKPNSLSNSPDMMALLPKCKDQELRALSSISLEDENFDTPPSSPISTPSPELTKQCSSSTLTAGRATQLEESVTATPTSILSSTTSTPSHTSTSSTPKIGHTGATNLEAMRSGSLEHIDGDSVDVDTLKRDGHVSSVFSHVTDTGTLKAGCHPAEVLQKGVGDTGLLKTPSAAVTTPASGRLSGSETETVADIPQFAVGGGDMSFSDRKVETDGEVHFTVVEYQDDTEEILPSPLKTPLQKMSSVPAGRTLVPPPKSRTRSMTTSESGTLPLRGKSHKKPVVPPVTSRDDNFSTEFKEDSHRLSNSDGLTSYFSQKDLEDIFKVGVSDFVVNKKIEPLNEGEEEEMAAEEEEGKGGEGMGTGEDGKGEVDQSSYSDAKECQELSASTTSSGFESHVVTPEQPIPSPEPLVVIIPDNVTPNQFLFQSTCESNFPGILCALAHGGSVNFVHENHGWKTSVLQAVEMGDKGLLEYLYQNGGKLLVTDSKGRGCLHLAAMGDDPNLIMMLLKRGARPRLQDVDGKDALDYALERANGDIVTMLRMAKFRSEAQSGSDVKQSECQKLESEYHRDIEVASAADSERISKRISSASLEGSCSTASKESKEQ